ncbi:hypothetical protein QBC42DRAFT_296395 [Cladorrhinum samala]|uniref:Uncharacterized protein n=1 Tax=Cladorrhinum samala TaxID=585594 RepID=A0AAV9HQL1_9PEZI|nr:hypothetical protein QBC42DRAFT_296395 [Cladorrhinum samala]
MAHVGKLAARSSNSGSHDDMVKHPIPSRYPRLLPRRDRWAAFWQRRGDDTWTWELLCILLSVLCIITIATILQVYDGRKPPSLPAGITINAVVSVLSTISKSALIFSVSAAIGQTKWDWYEKEPRRLYDMEIFDEASRGPLGAAKLLLTRQIMASFASVGAIVLILTLAVDPFIQQVISFGRKDTLVKREEVWTERLTKPSFIPSGEFSWSRMDNSSTDTELLDTLSGAIWNDEDIYARRANCPSGDCHFESFSSFEFCVDTETVTDLNSIHWSCSATFDEFLSSVSQFAQFNTSAHQTEQCSVWLGPKGTDPIPFTLTYKFQPTPSLPTTMDAEIFEFFDIEFPRSIITELTETVASFVLSGVNSLIAMGYVRFSLPESSFDFRDLKIESAEWAAIRPCKATHTVSVVNGSTSAHSSRSPMKLMHVSNDTAPGPAATLGDGASCWAPEEDEIRNMAISPLQRFREYEFISNATTMAFCARSMSYLWAPLISNRLGSVAMWKNIFQRSRNSSSKPSDWRHASSGNNISGSASQDIHVRVGKHTLGPVMRSITEALNNISRTRSQEERVFGFTNISETVLDVRWAWLALPIAVEALGVAFFLVVIFRRRSAAGLWKDSLLAAVYNGLDRQDDMLHRGNSWSMPDINDMARATRVQLLVKATEDGGKVVLGSPPRP